jgi:hypothetical protein
MAQQNTGLAEAILITGKEGHHCHLEREPTVADRQQLRKWENDGELTPPRLSPRPIDLVSNWCQRAPIMPVFPTHSSSNHLSVNNLRFRDFHGMEEVIGSIPIRSTKFVSWMFTASKT